MPLVVAAGALVWRRWRLAAALVLVVPLKLGLERVAKLLVQRQRPGTTVPDAILRGVPHGGLSFTSGHAIITFAIAGLLVLVLPPLGGGRVGAGDMQRGGAGVSGGAQPAGCGRRGGDRPGDRRHLDLILDVARHREAARPGRAPGARGSGHLRGGGGGEGGGGCAVRAMREPRQGLAACHRLGEVMTKPPETHAEAPAVAAKHGGRLLAPARYRHPGDVIRLILAGLVLAGAAAVTVAAHATYAGASAAAVTAVAPSTVAGRVLGGLVQAAFAVAAVAAVAVALRYRRFRLLASVAGAAVLAGAVVAGVVLLAGGERPRALAAGAGQWSWLTGASLVGPALLAAAVAGTVAAAPWLSRPWRRTAWLLLWFAAVARLITGTASPMEVVVAFAAGVTIGAGVLVLFGVPDRRIGPGAIAAALGSAGLPVTGVEPAAVEAKGSRPFTAVAEDGEPLFIKVLGSDQRDADLLYRAYRFIRLREVGDTRPAASLIQAVEHQALAAVMAGRAGVTVPAVRQVIKTADGSALLAMERVDGSSLDRIPGQDISDTMLRELWQQVDGLHRAGIAHRSLRAANIVADRTGRPWIVDFSFSELGATQRQMALDVAELLASLAAMIGAGRAVGSAVAVIGPGRRRGCGAVAAAAGSFGRHPPRGRPPRRPADRYPGGCRSHERAGRPGTGPHPARPPTNAACDRRRRGRVLLPAP